MRQGIPKAAQRPGFAYPHICYNVIASAVAVVNVKQCECKHSFRLWQQSERKHSFRFWQPEPELHQKALFLSACAACCRAKITEAVA